MNRSRLILLFLALATAAQALTVAAAADLRYALDQIVTAYGKIHPNDAVSIVYGSSGKLDAQIRQGAPYDLFFSADIAFPQGLAKDGLAGSAVEPYAVGRLVIWSSERDVSRWTLEDLAGTSIGKVAIANPEHAPSGKRAEEARRRAGVWEKVEPKLVYGENIAQTLQFAQTGAAQVGIVAQSLVLGLDSAKRGSWAMIPDSLHSPLVQGWVLTARGAKNDTARRFSGFATGPEAKRILSEFGFSVPHPPPGK
jgi:molybdate transport system substrate-binding protein